MPGEESTMPLTICPAGTDIFSLGAQTLVNPVNTVGTMGAGLAKEFARRYPHHLAWYRERCLENILVLGHPQLDRGQTPWILAFPTKRHWKENSRLIIIEEGLNKTRNRIDRSGIQSLALPALGCGLGGLPFESVQAQVENYLGDLAIQVWLIPPQ